MIHIANHPTDASCIFEAARAHLLTKEGTCWGSPRCTALNPLELGPAAALGRSRGLLSFLLVSHRTRLESAEIYRPQSRSRRTRKIFARSIADASSAYRSTALPQMKIRRLRVH